jgi:hypothetical protein
MEELLGAIWPDEVRRAVAALTLKEAGYPANEGV